MIRCAYVFTTVYWHDTCLRVCVGGGGGRGRGGGARGGCLASVSGPMCMFVFVIRVIARRFFLASKDKNKVLKSWKCRSRHFGKHICGNIQRFAGYLQSTFSKSDNLQNVFQQKQPGQSDQIKHTVVWYGTLNDCTFASKIIIHSLRADNHEHHPHKLLNL